METFGSNLINIRKELGHKSAKSFFQFLNEKGLECNYQYYMKVEKDQAFPSSIVVNQIAKALGTTTGQSVVLAYCKSQFQSFDYLFKDVQTNQENTCSKLPVSVSQGQRELTKREILSMGNKQENYFLFLLLTLSRGPVELEEVKKYLGLYESIEELEKIGIVKVSGSFVETVTSEFRFPIADDHEINKYYSLFDLWDIEFSSQFEFEKLINKTMIRRISPRYLSAIKGQIDTISDFVRLSDESEEKYNNDVLHLQIQLSRGELPG